MIDLCYLCSLRSSIAGCRGVFFLFVSAEDELTGTEEIQLGFLNIWFQTFVLDEDFMLQ